MLSARASDAEPLLPSHSTSPQSPLSPLSPHALLSSRFGRVAALALLVLLPVALLFLLLPRSPADYLPFLILVSLDGFRAEYLRRNLSPTLSHLVDTGLSADYLKPIFPSITFPNHYSLVTGLYAESHGIVGNLFWDPSLNDTFVYYNSTKNSDPKWWLGEPIWVSTIKSGMKAATMMWPGSEAPIKGIRPTYYQPYSDFISPTEKVSRILSWIDLPASLRPNFISLYLPQVDSNGHQFGVNSVQVNNSIKEVDAAIKLLLDGLNSRNVRKFANIVVVSDHGMTDLSLDRLIPIDELIPADTEILKYFENGPILSLYTSDDEKTFAELKNIAGERNFQIYTRDNVPGVLKYSASNRISPLIIIPDLGWHCTINGTKPYSLAQHGYDPVHPDMHAIFIANGPAFQSKNKKNKNLKIDPFENIQVYNLLAKVIGVDSPAENNGTQGFWDDYVVDF